MQHVLLLTVALSAITLEASATKQPFTLDDLTALVRDKSWGEALEKAKQIRPTERNDGWAALVAKAAVGRMQDPALVSQEAVGLADALLGSHPSLAKNKDFMRMRAKHGLDAYGRCFATSSVQSCDEYFKKFVIADKHDPAFAADAAQLVWRSFSSKFSAMPYYHHALEVARASGAEGAKVTAEVCASEQFRSAAASALRLAESSSEPVSMAKRAAFDWCWGKVAKGDFIAETLDGEHGYNNACQPLLEKKALRGVQESKCKRVAAGEKLSQ